MEAIAEFINNRGRKLWFLGSKHFYFNNNTRIHTYGEDLWLVIEVKDPLKGWINVTERAGPWQDSILALVKEVSKSQQERLEAAHQYESGHCRFNKLEIE